MRSWKMSLALAASMPALWAPEADAQQRALSFDARGGYGFPISDFGDSVESDFGFGAGLVFSLTDSFGIYGGWARDAFGCDELVVCDGDSQVKVQGLEVGVKFLIPTESRILPWLKAGLIAHEVKLETDVFESESDREYGFQAAAGLDFPLGEVVSVSPGLRFNMLEASDDAGIADPEVKYLSFDLGLHFHIPGN
jgi:hypothetical protein